VRQVHDLYDYEGQPFLLGYQNEDKIKKNGLKKGDFDFKGVIGVSMFGHVVMAKHKVCARRTRRLCARSGRSGRRGTCNTTLSSTCCPAQLLLCSCLPEPGEADLLAGSCARLLGKPCQRAQAPAR